MTRHSSEFSFWAGCFVGGLSAGAISVAILQAAEVIHALGY